MSSRLINKREQRLLTAIQSGFPLTARPYLAIGAATGMTEEEVIAALAALRQRGIITRMGIIVRHRELGYHANAMVVWNLPDQRIRAAGEQVSGFDFVTLCYQRRPAPPLWPYNLYCMIHGRERGEVLDNLDNLEQACNLKGLNREVLFSRRCFKQRGARYFAHRPPPE